MATYYWVGGAGTWDATTTTNWATSSGGAGSAGVPTSTDNVIFDILSNATLYTVTVGTNALAADVTIAGPASGNVTISAATTSIITCYGSWTSSATGVAFSATGSAQITFQSATTGKTITTNGVSLSGFQIAFNVASGGWTLGSTFSTGGNMTVNNGAFSTGNFNVTANSLISTNPVTRSITLGSSTLTLLGATPISMVSTNLTFNAGTSTIICSGAAPTFAGGGLTYYNVNFTSSAGGNVTAITGNNTFTNLNQTSPTTNRRAMSLGANQIVTDTFTPGAANLYNARVQVQSSGSGSPVTLTVATIAALSDVDFRDIIAAGASGTWSGTRLGNGLGNTNITFVAGKTVYWNLVAGGAWSLNAWALSSGGAVATANFPLAQDTVIIDDTGLTTGNSITMDAPWWMGVLNVTRTNAWTYSCGASVTIYGASLTLTSVTTVVGTANFLFLGQGLTQTLTTAGVTLTTSIIQQSVGGTLVLNGAVTCASTATVTLNNGTLNLANYTLTTGVFNSTNSNVRTLAFGTGKVVVTGNNSAVINLDTATNFSFTGSGNFESTYSGATGTRSLVVANTAGGSQAVAMNLKVTAGTDIVQVYFYWNDVDFTGFAGTFSITGNKNYYGSLTLSTGMTLGSGSTPITFKATSGTKTITTAGKTFDFPLTFDGVGGTWAFQDALTMGATRALTLTNGTLQLAAGTTSTVGSFVTTGTNTKYLQSTTPGVQATISDASGTDAVSSLVIQDSNATGGATWDATAATNTNGGGNTGWTFLGGTSMLSLKGRVPAFGFGFRI